MPLSIVYSRATAGISAPLVTVEVDLTNGMAGLSMVGLPETAVKESKDRVRSALMNTSFEFPARRITVNLAPADLPKEGGRFDLPIALGILAASNQIPQEILSQYEFVGELALSGELRPVRGVLPVAIAARAAGRSLIVPSLNAEEASLAAEGSIFSANHLLEVCEHLQGKAVLPTGKVIVDLGASMAPDLSEVKGQVHAKQALEIAAAGRHSLLFVGPPGTGKTMLASRLSGILPPLSEKEALEVAAIASVSSNGFSLKTWRQVAFRAPHHSSSSVALVGGGRPPRPGEISLAHHGVLFLDELPEFSRQVLECLREPLESGNITISRAAFQSVFPASFQLMAAMNPCPCGFAGSQLDQCQCTPEQVKRYMNKISGPLLDRIDMHVEVPRIKPEVLSYSSPSSESSSESVRERVRQARAYQMERQQKLNVNLTVNELHHFGNLTSGAEKWLIQIMSAFHFSARVYHRIVKVARTIADLSGVSHIEEEHVALALQYRVLDKQKRINT